MWCRPRSGSLGEAGLELLPPDQDAARQTIAGTFGPPQLVLRDPAVKFAVIRALDLLRLESPFSYAHLLAGVDEIVVTK